MAVTVNPLQLLVGVGSLYIAAADTTFPTPDAAPNPAQWTYLGVTEGGVTVDPTQKLVEIYVDQETGPVKVIREQENLKVSTHLAVFTLENLVFALNNNPVTVTAPTGGGSPASGFKEIQFYQGGPGVASFSLIFQGASPYLAGFTMRYLIPNCFFATSSTAKAFKKNALTFIPAEFMALVDYNAPANVGKFGKLQAINLPHT